MLCKEGNRVIKNCIRTGWNETEDKIVKYDYFECLYYLINFFFFGGNFINILLIEKKQYIELEDPKPAVRVWSFSLAVFFFFFIGPFLSIASQFLSLIYHVTSLLGFNGLVTSMASIFDWVWWTIGEKATLTAQPFSLTWSTCRCWIFVYLFNCLLAEWWCWCVVKLRLRMTYKTCACYIVTDTRFFLNQLLLSTRKTANPN